MPSRDLKLDEMSSKELDVDQLEAVAGGTKSLLNGLAEGATKGAQNSAGNDRNPTLELILGGGLLASLIGKAIG